MRPSLKLLSLDSSTPQGNVALTENLSILKEASQTDAGYSEQLLHLLDSVLSGCGMTLNDVDGFVITTGPGSFTGLRVGISIAKGLVMATEKPFIGIDTLEAVASLHAPTDSPVCAILDARKKEVYAAIFRFIDGKLTRQTEDAVLPPEKLCAQIKTPTHFTGPGLRAYGDMLAYSLGALYMSGGETGGSIAGAAAKLAYERFEKGKSLDLDSLSINYVRKSEAELNFGS